MSENLLREGAATFYIYDKALTHKDNDPFIRWLKSEGFTLQNYGHPTTEHGLYINVKSKVYNWGMGGVSLSYILFDHAIHMDEFKQIYNIFKRYEGLPAAYYTIEEYRAVFEDDDSHLTKSFDKIDGSVQLQYEQIDYES